jgi:multidrug efflux pump
VPQLFYQLRKKLSDIKDDLPSGLIGPSVNDEWGDVDSILYMLTADGADYAQMKKVAEAFRQRLLKVKNVTKVNLYGTQDEKIFVEFSHAKLATLGITPDQLFQSLARQNAVVPAGILETTAQRVPLRVTPIPGRRYRHHNPWLCRSAGFPGPPKKQAGHRHRHCDGQGRQYP